MSVVLLSGKVQFLTAYLRPACALKVTSLQNVRLKSTSFLVTIGYGQYTLYLLLPIFYTSLHTQTAGNVSHEQQKLNMHPSEVSFDKLTPISMGYHTFLY